MPQTSRKPVSTKPSTFNVPLGIDTNNFNMNWLETPACDDPMLWDPSLANNLTFDYDYASCMNDLNEFFNLEPKAYAISNNDDDNLNFGDVFSPVPSPSDTESELFTRMSRQSSNQSSSRRYTNMEKVSLTPNLFDTDKILATIETEQPTSPISIPSSSPSLKFNNLPTSRLQQRKQHAAFSSSSRLQQRKQHAALSSSADENQNGEIKKSKKKKLAHNIIEKRYRMNMNSKFVALSNALPDSCSAKSSGKPSPRRNSSEQHPPNKSEVLANALTYIHQLEARNASLKKEVEVLKENLLPRSSSMKMGTQQQQRRQYMHHTHGHTVT